jgi:hypothetical protein
VMKTNVLVFLHRPIEVRLPSYGGLKYMARPAGGLEILGEN